jgi:DNA-binding XRE family transcriptional regulator
MPSVDVTAIILGEEARELENAYNSDPRVKSAIDQFDAECKLRKELVKARKQKNLTQKQIKEATGLTQQVISRIESNTDISPSLKNLMIYANTLGFELTLQPKQDTSSSL